MNSRYLKNKEKWKLEKRERNKHFRKKIIISIFILFIVIGAYGFFVEPNILSINDYKISDNDIPHSFDGVRIVQFSDLHYGTGFNEYRFKKLIYNINELKPDIVIFTGDLIDKNYKISDTDVKTISKYLNKIDAKLGKYAVFGNHDYSFDNYEDIMYDSSFTVLKNNYDTVYNGANEAVLIFGFDDTLFSKPDASGLNDKNINNIKYRIILVHEPDYVNDFMYDYDYSLILSGHSHNGQVKLPFIRPLYLPNGSKEYYKAHYSLDNGDLYVSNGVGNSLVDFRLFNLPSINLYRLYSN